MLLVRALYDNEPDAEDELSFRRNEVLTVHEIDTDGMEGWWLCSLRGQLGIVPANRLKPISQVTTGSGSGSARSTCSSQDLILLQEHLPDYDIPSASSEVVKSSHDVTDAPHSSVNNNNKIGVLPSSTTTPLRPSVTPESNKLKTKSLAPSELDADYDTPKSFTPEATQPSAESPASGRFRQGAKIFKNLFKRQPQQSDDYTELSSHKKKQEKSGKEKSFQQKHSRADSGYDFGKTLSDAERREESHLSLLPADRRLTSNALGTDRDSCLADYDVPASREEFRPINSVTSRVNPVTSHPNPVTSWRSMEELEQTDYDIPSSGAENSRNTLNVTTVPSRFTRSRSSGNILASSETPERASMASTVNNAELISSIKTKQQELRELFSQMSTNCTKWKELKNFIAKASAARLSLTAAWKRLEVLLPMLSKLSTHADGGAILKRHVENLRKLSDKLEEIVGYLTKANSGVLEKAEYDYITPLSVACVELEQGLAEMWSTVEENSSQLSNPPKMVSRKSDVKVNITSPGNSQTKCNSQKFSRAPQKQSISKAVSSSDLLESWPPSYSLAGTNKEKSYLQTQRRSMDSILNTVSNEDYDTPNSSVMDDYDVPNSAAVEDYVIPKSATEDYDIPKFAGTEDYDIPKEAAIPTIGATLNRRNDKIKSNQLISNQTGLNKLVTNSTALNQSKSSQFSASTPKQGGSNLLDPSRTGSDRSKTGQAGSNLLRWNAQTGSTEAEKGKRTAFVMDKGNEQFDIFQRRNCQTKAAPIKMVAGSMGGGAGLVGGVLPPGDRSSDEHNVVDTSDGGPTVDYDYPMPSNDATDTKQMPQSDRQILQFYTPAVVQEATTLKLVCNELYETLYNTTPPTDNQLFVNRARCLFVSLHKLQYIGDSILRGITCRALRDSIQLRVVDMGKAADPRTVISTAQTAQGMDETSKKARQRLAECSKTALIAALKFVEIIARPKLDT